MTKPNNDDQERELPEPTCKDMADIPEEDSSSEDRTR